MRSGRTPKGVHQRPLVPAAQLPGAAPIHWAVLNGDRETGVTIMHMAHDLDAGDIIAQAATPIDPDETVVALHDRLAVLGAELLVNVVADIAAGTATRTPRSTARPPWPPC